MAEMSVVHCSDGTPLEVHWADESFKHLSFAYNGEHWTFPASPMDVWLDPIAPRHAGPAFEEVGLLPPLIVQFAGPFQYVARPVIEGEQLAAAAAAVTALMSKFGSPAGFWRAYCQPRAEAAVSSLEGALRGGPIQAAADTYAYGLAQTFTSVVPLIGIMIALRGLLEQRFGTEGGLLADEATQGGANASQSLDADVMGIANLARSTPSVARILTQEGLRDRLDALRSEPAAQPFLGSFEALIAAHHSRSFGWELTLPTWSEDPGAVLAMVAAHLRASGAHLTPEKSVAVRDAARRRISEALDDAPRDQFLQMIAALDGLVGVREDRAYWQMRLTGAMRLLLLDRGRRLVGEGLIDAPDDILFLVPEEFEKSGAHDWRGVVMTRRAEWEKFRSVTPPPVIAAPLPFTEPQFASATELRGYPGSRGRVTARARIIDSADDIDRFEEGDILVCRMTTPAWTPLFALASAVVTETGSALSHPAVVAREYGIPCVLSAPEATTRIRDGSTITVDGTAGAVLLHGQ